MPNEEFLKKVAARKRVSAQAVFNAAVLGVLSQGKKSENAGFCQYRGDDGLACALGQLIPDEMYNPDMEGMDAHELHEDKLLPSSLRPHIALLADLQAAHDNSAVWRSDGPFIEGFKRRCREVAEKHGLQMPALPGELGAACTQKEST